jgi:hypothetical protein
MPKPKSALLASCAAAVALGVLVGPFIAWAAGPKDDRAAAEAAIATIEASPQAKASTGDQVRKAKDALERARRMRTAGDDAHARLAEAVALEWTRAAQESVRASEAEAKAATAKLGSMDAGAAAERERAMLEQQIAENGRMQAELRALEDAGSKTVGKDPVKDVATKKADAGVKR